jgi:FAR1 DNA-binding domain
MPNNTADMSSSNNSTPSPDGRESAVVIPITPGSHAAAQASAQASGVASNAFAVRDNQGIVPLSLPPEGTFESWEAAKEAANRHAGLAGYAVVEGRGGRRDPDKKFRWKRFLICKHGDSHCHDKIPLNEEQRKRKNRMSKKTSCQVKLKVQERPDGSWTLHHMEGHMTHNHDFNDITSYHEHRKLTEGQVLVVDADYTAGIQPNRIKRSLKAANPGIHVITRDIYNHVARLKRDSLKGKRPNDALIEKLTKQKEEGAIFFEYALSEEGRIEKMFMADMR